MGHTALGTSNDDGGDRPWICIAVDAQPEYFGDIMGELNRTGWTITGSEELDENRQALGNRPTPPLGWQRIYAKRRIIAGVQGLLG